MSTNVHFPSVEEGHHTVAIDLDGVLAKDVWPWNAVGELLPGARELVLHYFDQGYQVVVYTARPASHARMVWDWLRRNVLDYAIYDVVTNKPVAGLYIDDRAYRWEGREK